jgi:uncharacterized delta-60 repeat protein
MATNPVHLSTQAQIELTVTRVAGFASDITITFPDLPATLQASGIVMTPATNTAVIPISGDLVTETYQGTFSIHAEGGGISRVVTVAYAHFPPPTFSMTTSASATLARTTTLALEVVLTRSASWTGGVTINARDLPSGVTATELVISPVIDRGTLTLSAEGTASIGTSTIRLEGVAAGIEGSRETTLELTVAEVPSFSLSAPTSVNVRQADSTSIALSVTRSSGFTSALSTALLAAPSGITVSDGAFAETESTSSLTIHAAPTSLLLVPSTASIQTSPTSGSAQTAPLTITVTPEADTALDTSFALGGGRLVEAAGISRAHTSRALPNGNTVVVASANAMRLLADGTLDSSYGVNGVTEVVLPLFSTEAAIASDGSFYAACSGTDETTSVTHVLASGATDASFGVNGTTAPLAFGRIEAIKIRPSDGSLWLVGYTSRTNFDMVVAKLTSAGVPDTTFGTGGVVAIDFGANDFAKGIAFAASGSVTVIGYSEAVNGQTSVYALARLTSVGSLDTSFDGDGKRTIGSAEKQAVDVGLDTAQGYVVGGPAIPGTGSAFYRMSRFTTAGQLDTSFGSAGSSDFAAGASLQGNDIIQDASGRFVIAGQWASAHAVVVVTSQGVMDTTFSEDGRTGFRGGSGGLELATSLSLDAMGRYLVFGYFGGRTLVGRFLP